MPSSFSQAAPWAKYEVAGTSVKPGSGAEGLPLMSTGPPVLSGSGDGGGDTPFADAGETGNATTVEATNAPARVTAIPARRQRRAAPLR